MNRTSVLAALASFQDNVLAVMPGAPLDMPAIMQWIRTETVDRETADALEEQLDTTGRLHASALEDLQQALRTASQEVTNRQAAEGQVQHLQTALEAAAARHADLNAQVGLLRATLQLECSRPFHAE